MESISSSTDSAYSEAASSPASSSGDERLLDDVDEEYSSGEHGACLKVFPVFLSLEIS